MPLQQTPESFTISPAGYLVQHNWVSYPHRGVVTDSTVVPIQGGSQISRGLGDLPVPVMSSAAGTLRLHVITPSIASCAVVFLVDSTTAPKGYLGIGLDSNKRAFLVVKDHDGAVVAQTTSSAANGATGVPLAILFSWNANIGYVSLNINNVNSPSGDYTTNPSKAWTPFVPAAIALGPGYIPALSAFPTASGIQSVQYSPTPLKLK